MSIKLKDKAIIDSDKLDGKDSAQFASSSHTHSKSQISDFPTSLPANGGNADTVGGKKFNWQFGTKAPSHLWGSEGSSTEQYVYQPSQVSVGHSINADNAYKLGGSNALDYARYIGSNPSIDILNNAAHNQNYDCWVHSAQATEIGLPDANNWHLSFKRHLNGDGYGTQIAMPYGRNEMYIRSSSGKTWSEWSKVYTTKSKPTPAEIGAAKAYTSANGYDGITLNDGSTGNWIRTTSNGLLPFASGGNTSNLGTNSWRFKEIHGVNIFANGVNVGTELNNLKSSLKNSGGIKSVQSGRYGYGGSKDNNTVKISAVNVSKSFVLVNCFSRMNSTNTGLGYGYLENSTNLILKFSVERSYSMTVAWQVIEFY